MSNIKELIRQEIERRKNKAETMRERGAYIDLLSFLDTLPDESEQPTIGYDEAYLNEKIAKASKSWEGVDVDKFMDEVRGREPVTDCHELEEEIKEQIYGRFYDLNGIAVIGTSGYAEVKDMEDIARHFAEWQRKQDEENYAWVKQLPNPNTEKLDGIEITTSDSSAGGKELLYVSNKSYNIGLRDGMAEQKRKMMEGAVEGVVYRYESYQRIATAIIVDVPKESLGNKVKIIIVKED